MSKTKSLAIALIMTMIIVSCVPSQSDLRTPTPPRPTATTQTQLVPSTRTPEASPSPTQAIVVSQPTASPLPTQVKIGDEPPGKMVRQCATDIPLTDHRLWSNGSVFYSWLGSALADKTNIEAISSTTDRARIVVKDASATSISLSPNGDYLAWDTTSPADSQRNLVIHEISSGREQVFPWQESWTGTAFWGWKSETVLWLKQTETALPGGGFQTKQILFDLTTLNSKTVQEPAVVLPDQDQDPVAFGSFAAVDSTQSRALYTVYKSDLGWGVAMRNLENNTELWRTYDQSTGSYAFPAWSPDGAKVIAGFLPAGKVLPELFSLSRDGKSIRQLTDFQSLYTNYHINDMTWSQNGRFILFTLQDFTTQSFPAPKVLLFDLEQNIVIDTCMQTYDITLSGRWLPESDRYIFLSTAGAQVRLTMFDVTRNESQILVDSNGNSKWPDIIGWSPVVFP